jgi:hypothetical protein
MLRLRLQTGIAAELACAVLKGVAKTVEAVKMTIRSAIMASYPAPVTSRRSWDVGSTPGYCCSAVQATCTPTSAACT